MPNTERMRAHRLVHKSVCLCVHVPVWWHLWTWMLDLVCMCQCMCEYVCMCVYFCMRVHCACTFAQKFMSHMSRRKRVPVYMHIFLMSVHLRVCVHIAMHFHVHVHVNVHMFLYMSACITVTHENLIILVILNYTRKMMWLSVYSKLIRTNEYMCPWHDATWCSDRCWRCVCCRVKIIDCFYLFMAVLSLPPFMYVTLEWNLILMKNHH